MNIIDSLLLALDNMMRNFVEEKPSPCQVEAAKQAARLNKIGDEVQKG